jgi:hypothetical protein
MDINDLKPGDVLLFSGEKGSFISEAIMFLSNAPVSHAAMAYSPSNTIVEETPPAVQTNPAAMRFESRKITVMRHKPPQASYVPVLKAATCYLNNQEPYAKSNLYLVGMLLIYRKFTPDTLAQRVIIKLLKKLTAAIIDYYNEHKNPGKLPMVCSQFVYQCYEDAGTAYKLKIENGVLLTAAEGMPPVASLLDQAIYRVRNDTTPGFRDFIAANTGMALMAPEEQSDEELANELLQAFRAAAPLSAEAAEPLEDELVLAIQNFSQAVHLARTGLETPADELVQANSLRMASTSMAQLKAEEAYFVAPGDLLQHCTNLTWVGEIDS